MKQKPKAYSIIENYEDAQPQTSSVDQQIYLPHRGRRVNKIQPVSKSTTPSLKMIQDAEPCRKPSKSQYSEKSKGCLKSSKLILNPTNQRQRVDSKHKEIGNSELKSIKFSEVINDVFIYMIEEKYKDGSRKQQTKKPKENKENEQPTKKKQNQTRKYETKRRNSDTEQCIII